MNVNGLVNETSLFYLSRIGSTSYIGDLELHATLSCPTGQGLHLSTRYDEIALNLWVNEAAWCDWLEPQLTAPSFAQIDQSLHQLLASWTLAPLDEWLQTQGLSRMAPATICRADAPTQCWCLTIRGSGRRLSIYLDGVPPVLIRQWLSAMTPNSTIFHEFGLLLGWCTLSLSELGTLAKGDVLTLHGIDDALGRFWLKPREEALKPADQLPSLDKLQLQLNSDLLGQFTQTTYQLPPPSFDSVELIVECGSINLEASTLACCSTSFEFPVHITTYPTLRLLKDSTLLAEGILLRMDDGWAIRLTSLVCMEIVVM
ncbi:hypothetical protein ACET8U_22615 [Aeromonas veronii]